MKSKSFFKKNILWFILAAAVLVILAVIAVLIFYPSSNSDRIDPNVELGISSTGISELAAEKEAERLAEEERKAAEEEAERQAAEEEARKKAEEEEKAKAEAEREEEEKREKYGETYEEYSQCMEKVRELEKTLSSDPSAWNMILCNPTHPLPDDYIDGIELSSIYGRFQVDSRIYYNVRAMFLAAEMDGINLSMVSAFRDVDLQTRNFNNKKNYYIGLGYSEEDAYAKTATIIAVPGTSEHHTGLALDILTPSYTSLTAGFDQTKAYAWLVEHCAEYGFILRYAKDKTDITKIIYEPWHYRFVGIENAKKIMASGLSYEEYLGVLD